MFSRSLVLLSLVAWMLWVPLLSGLTASAQEGGTRRGRSSPATGHAAVIAQAVMPMLAAEFGWQVTSVRAVLPVRAAATAHAGGFIVAIRGIIAVTDERGVVLARLAAGEATSVAPGQMLAVVGLDQRAADYVEISLQAADDLSPASGSTQIAGPFPAPAGGPFDVDLIRDTVLRAEESSVPAGAAPSLLMVTSGAVFTTTSTGEIVALETGGVLSFTGQVDVSGASRTAATIVVARIGQAVPERVGLQGQPEAPLAATAATPVAQPDSTAPPVAELAATPAVEPAELPETELSATPVPEALATPEPAAAPAELSLAVTAFNCPAAYTGEDFAADCVTPAEGTAFSLESGGTTFFSFLADEAGQVDFSGIKPGRYTLLVGLRDPSAYSRVTCLDASDTPIGAETAPNLAAVEVAAGATVQCTWFIVPHNPEADSAAHSLQVAVLACLPGMTAETLVAELCGAAPPGVFLSLLAGKKPLGVAVASAERWIWSGFAPRAYDLVVNALPPPFTASQLDQRHCCNDRGGYTISLGVTPANAVSTLFLFQPLDKPAAKTDSDDDGLSEAREMESGTNPFLVDTDSDGLSDADEVDIYGTEPRQLDTDGDGLDDGEEIGVLGTNPFLKDTDGDGITDREEKDDGG